MKKTIIFFLLIFFGFLTPVWAIDAADLLLLTNQQRTNAGLNPLSLNQQLNEAATAKANDMLTHNYWAHVSPSGVTPWNFIQKTNYKYKVAGENLASGYNTAKGVVDGWMNSPSHRKNILNSKLCEVGFGVVSGKLQGKDTTIVVQMLACPKKIPTFEAKSLSHLVPAFHQLQQIVYSISRPLFDQA